MSMLDKIKAWFTAVAPSREVLCLVDGAALTGGNRTNGRLNPREQIQLLRRIALFAEREGFNVQVVFEGRSLREVAHGEDFGARVKVFFADSAAGVQEILRKQVEAVRSRKPIVVAANRKFEEEVVALGARVMRANTFRKGMELALSSSGGEAQPRPNQPPSGRRRNRNRGSRGQPPQQRPPNGASAGGETASAPQSIGGSAQEPSASPEPPSAQKPPVDDAVRNLIDLVE